MGNRLDYGYGTQLSIGRNEGGRSLSKASHATSQFWGVAPIALMSLSPTTGVSVMSIVVAQAMVYWPIVAGILALEDRDTRAAIEAMLAANQIELVSAVTRFVTPRHLGEGLKIGDGSRHA